MERKGDKVFVEGKKVFEVNERQPRPGSMDTVSITLTPLSYRSYRSIHPTASKKEWEDQVNRWFNEYQELDYQNCIKETEERLCYQEALKESKSLAQDEYTYIHDKCSMRKRFAFWDVYW